MLSSALVLYKFYFNFLVITVSFSNSSYSVSEDKGRVEIALILSKPSFTNIVVIVTDIQGTAAG